jgi:methyl-accepting chemotaxis protein
MALGVALLLTEAIVQPILQLRDVLGKLAKGDLTPQLNFKNNDEFAELKTTFNASLISLRELIGQLYVESAKVNEASEELALQAKTQVTGSSQQVNSIDEATATLEELSQTAQNISKQIGLVAEAAEHSLQEAHMVSSMADEMAQAQEEGRGTIAHTITGLRNLKSQIEVIEEQQQNLRERSRVIEEVVGIIDSISRETHLLALNAAIEAAGAGEAGNRFSVIAHAVKQLADRSMNATQKVRATIGGITSTIEQSTQEAEKALHEAELAVQDASNSDETLINLANISLKVKNAAHSILNLVETTTGMAIEIEVASTQQRVANSIMLDKMLEVKMVTSHTLESVTEGERATKKLNISAHDLKQAANSFKLVV